MTPRFGQKLPLIIPVKVTKCEPSSETVPVFVLVRLGQQQITNLLIIYLNCTEYNSRFVFHAPQRCCIDFLTSERPRVWSFRIIGSRDFANLRNFQSYFLFHFHNIFSGSQMDQFFMKVFDFLNFLTFQKLQRYFFEEKNCQLLFLAIFGSGFTLFTSHRQVLLN